ncbi:MAG: hypothetical protein Q9183_000304 [Haloplaca sp. 2 TL-2023]
MNSVAARHALLHPNPRRWLAPWAPSSCRFGLTTTPRYAFSGPSINSYGTLERRKKQQNLGLPVPESASRQRLEHKRFQLKTESIGLHLPAIPNTLQQWIEDFLQLGSAGVLQTRDSGEVARILHNLDRKYRTVKDKETQGVVSDLVENVREAYVAGTLPQAAPFPLHLFSYYKESGRFEQGISFWNWLSKTDDAAFSPTYAGAAIEFLAIYGAGVRYCEDVFQRTLDQQGDINSQYHLSPGAILPDRSKAVKIKGTSLGLLQGILTARVLYGKWQSAFLALDTAFRLRPTQVVPRVVDLIIYERPVFEALPIFFMYCRGGNRFTSGKTLMGILKPLKALVSQMSPYKTQAGIVRAMFSAVEAYIGSAGVLTTQHLNFIIATIIGAMPQRSAKVMIESDPAVEGLPNDMLEVLAKLAAVFSGHNATPNEVTFAQIISTAVSRGYPEIALAAAQDMVDMGVPKSEQVAFDLLKAAGLLLNPELLKLAWTSICNISHYEKKKPHHESWSLMTVVARSCGLESYAEEQLQALAPEIVVQSVQTKPLLDFFTTEEKSRKWQSGDARACKDMCTDIHEYLDRMKDMKCGTFRNFKEDPLDEDTVFAWPEVANESWQRKLYDEVSLDPNRGRSSKPSPARVEDMVDFQDQLPSISDTGIEFDELRYLNWKTINTLLVQAEVYEKRREASTNAAIEEQSPSSVPQGTTSHGKLDKAPHLTSADRVHAYLEDVENERNRQMTEEEWRTSILRLRNPEYEAPVDSNTSSLP